MPQRARQNIARLGMYGENAELSRKVLELGSGHARWMVPAADDLIGVYDAVGGGGVTDLEHIVTGESWGLDICAPNLPAGMVRFHGELPDDAADVTVVAADGTRIEPTVGENAWALELPASPGAGLLVRLEFRSGDTQRVVAIDAPADSRGTTRGGPPSSLR
ncbi:MAG: hypothetical protein QOJ35_4116 [Solirubrobacteraceae bacterium]|nr:hypothetical protein [Solirubrobacteraceae bacterium]